MNIRNFSIIAHIDHGKSTLADRMLELTGAVEKRKMRAQYLDNLELERERGITIKLQTVRMNWKTATGEPVILNLIDTPGHVDFSYEVSRALAACEGAVLLVDATQGVQAQTISHALKALDLGLTLIPAINKIDLPSAQPERVAKEVCDTFGFKQEEIVYVSGKTGKGVKELLDKIVTTIPACQGDSNKSLQGLIFDSFYDDHKGAVALVRIFEGKLNDPNESLFFLSNNLAFLPMEWGYLHPGMKVCKEIEAGEVCYIATGLKSIRDVRVGDTVTFADDKAKPLHGYQPPTPMVFASFFPLDADEWPRFREAFEKLTLNDAAVQFSTIHHPALGSGYRCGFLGLLHMDVVRERLEKEHDIDVLVASPSVPYEVTLTKGEKIIINEPEELPSPDKITTISEPYVKAEVITPQNEVLLSIPNF
jgi:GTP-binding protein LepA